MPDFFVKIIEGFHYYYSEYGKIIRFLLSGVSGVLLYAIAYLIVQPLISRTMDRANIDDHARKPLLKITWILLLLGIFAVMFAIAGFGNLLTSLSTIAAAGTLAIGFAMQNVIKNFVSGVFIFLERPFRIGDWIEWEDFSGLVTDINLRVTRVKTFDNEMLTVPNSTLTDNVLKNPVSNDKLRVKFVFGIGYDDDIGRATEIIIEEAKAHNMILNDPEPSVRLTELGDNSVGLQSRFWIQEPARSDFVKARSDYVTAVKKRFDQEGIEFPYPQRELSGEVEVGDSSDRP